MIPREGLKTLAYISFVCFRFLGRRPGSP